jgi:hypothetical protein
MPSLLSLGLLGFFINPSLPQTGSPNWFLIDSDKPFVYLAFDHVGKREPIMLGESDRGLWLRFVNNCRLPVIIRTFGTGTKDPGIGVIDEIVPSAALTGIVGNEKTPRELKELSQTDGPPRDYSFEVYSSNTVAPNESVLFSVPLEHVSPKWYLRVRFELGTFNGDARDRPYSYVNFIWDKLPEEAKTRK